MISATLLTMQVPRLSLTQKEENQTLPIDGRSRKREYSVEQIVGAIFGNDLPLW